jgi:hypothetical protein
MEISMMAAGESTSVCCVFTVGKVLSRAKTATILRCGQAVWRRKRWKPADYAAAAASGKESSLLTELPL